MHHPKDPSVEKRLLALQDYEVMDTAPEANFDGLALLASQICEQPMALVTLLDDRRQWFKAKVGLSLGETAIEHAFCNYAIQQPQQVLIVEDATQDARFCANPYVVGEPQIRFYAGAPIITPQGVPLGTVCVIGSRPHQITVLQREALVDLARQASVLLEVRRLYRENAQSKQRRLQDEAHIHHLQKLLPVCPHCKGQRDQEDYWHSVENYLIACGDQHQIKETCPKCSDHYAGLEQAARRLPARSPLLRLQAPTGEVTADFPEPPAPSAAPSRAKGRVSSRFEYDLAPKAATPESEISRLRYALEVQTLKYTALQTSEAYFRHLTEYSLDLITILEADGTIRFESRSIEHQFGHDPAHYRGRNAFDFVHPEDRTMLMQAFAEALDRQGNTSLLRFRFRHSDGSYRILEGTGNNLLLDTAVRGIVFNSRDITERVQLQDAVEAARLEKEETIAGLIGEVAHDFNNVLTGIQGLAELTLARVRTGSQEARNLADIRTCTDRAAQLTRQLLAFSRRLVLQPRALLLQPWLLKLIPELQVLLGLRIELSVITEGELRVWQDPAQLEQVLFHLASNARDAMPEGGHFTLHATAITLTPPGSSREGAATEEKYVRLTVTDDGFGMSDSTLGRIFEPFFSDKTSGHHPGLGLCMCRGIIEQSGGHLSVKSKAGSGTTFQIYLPAVEAVDEDIPEAPKLVVSPGIPTILFVDDEPVLREIGETILLEGGYQVIIAQDGPDALARLAELGSAPLDLLVTDVIMPGMTGVQLAEEVTRLRPGTRVLLCSGYTRDALAGSGGIPQGVAFLPKPYSLAVLLSKVGELLSHKPA